MSSVFKGIKKIFKKIVKVVKKIAPIVVGIGALIFTGGAALGLASAAGGWGAAVSAVTAKLGVSGLLGSALTGAITQAGYGALTGGVISALAGGSFSTGLKRGAAAGAVTGGLLSAYSHLRTPGATAAGAQGTTIDGATGQVIEGGATTYPLPAQAPPAPLTSINAAGEVIPAVTGGATTQAANAGGGLLSRVGGFMERNPELTGNLIKGVGTGLLAGAGADAERDLLRERYNLTAANYAGADPGASYRSAAPGSSGQTPTERFDPKTYGSFEYQYDPQVGRIVRVPAGT